MTKSKGRAILIDGKPYRRPAKGGVAPLRGKTDWARLDRLTTAQVESIAKADVDGPPMTDDEWAAAEITTPRKVSVGLRIDDDVLGWFKSQGKGYQTRINSVLRRYYETRRKAG